jgi:hypothetical protein
LLNACVAISSLLFRRYGVAVVSKNDVGVRIKELRVHRFNCEHPRTSERLP